VFNLPLEVEHIIPVARGGEDTMTNWALACRACNLYKAAHVRGRDPDSEAVVRLFHGLNQAYGPPVRPIGCEKTFLGCA
jgi:hypothetical protein